ncbi:hypothetical protein ATHL_01292 [Anaerolinea thermolimosa]|uniref:hypothetical protein n=1 Tax=Anaerolinea thermolimosa TaxID=229919 RepID=UPI0007820B0D|nr:hypothetical protein [Anaerolinea thermolimosa]GAP06438.1 hypothetical protein ATHL_01292 [Anaerolinea thermolimosa]
MNRALFWLIPSIFLLALIAALAGLWPAKGTSYPLTTFRGEEVMINARGLYFWDTLSSAAQMQANDAVTLFLGLPLLAVSFWLAQKNSLRGKLLLTGTLGFILYTYASMCFGTAYNQLFLVYVALFSLSLFAFILSMMSFDLKRLPMHFSEKLPRRWIAGLLFFTAAFLSLAWLGRVAATFTPGAVPALENTTSMFIQALDLGVIVPLCGLSGVLLLRQSAWGYLLASVGLVKFLTLGTAVGLMALNMARVGVPVSPIELIVFPAMALVGVGMTILLLKHIKDQPK